MLQIWLEGMIMVNASYYQLVKPLTNTPAGAEVSHRFSTNENTFSLGTQHAVDRLTTLKAPANNFGKVNALILQEWRPKSFLTISVVVDTKTIEKSAKIGLVWLSSPEEFSAILAGAFK